MKKTRGTKALTPRGAKDSSTIEKWIDVDYVVVDDAKTPAKSDAKRDSKQTAVSTTGEEKIGIQEYARQQSKGATGGALAQLDSSIREITAATKLTSNRAQSEDASIEEIAQTVRSMSSIIQVMNEDVESLMRDSTRSLGMLRDIGFQIEDLNDSVDDHFEKLNKKLDKLSLGEGGGLGDLATGLTAKELLKKTGSLLKTVGKAAVKPVTLATAATAATAYGLYSMRDTTKEIFGESYEKGDLNRIKNRAMREGAVGMTATDAELQDIVNKPDVARSILEDADSNEEWKRKSAEADVARYGRQNLERIARGEKPTVADMRAAGPKQPRSVENIRQQIEAAAGPNVTQLQERRGEAVAVQKPPVTPAGGAVPTGAPSTETNVAPAGQALPGATPTPKPGDFSGVNNNVINLIKNEEGFTPVAKWDNLQWTNGYGTRAKFPGEVITREEAEARITQQVSSLKAYVSEFGSKNGYSWNESQINALTSFAYNLGPGSISQVTNGGTRSNEEITSKMLEYNRAGGAVAPGLVARRQRESALFGGPSASPSTQPQTRQQQSLTVPVTPPGAVPIEDTSAAAMPPSPITPAATSVPTPETAEGTSRAQAAPSGVIDPTVDSSRAQYAPSGPLQGVSQKPQNVMVESDRVNLSGVDQDLLGKVYAAAQEYGRPVSINSAFRTDEYQAQLWARWKTGEPGLYMPATPKNAQRVNVNGQVVNVPGGGAGSPHNAGQAIDLSPGAPNSKGYPTDPTWTSILQKYGLTFPFGGEDPPHVQKTGTSTGGRGGKSGSDIGGGQASSTAGAMPTRAMPQSVGTDMPPVTGSRAHIPGVLGSVAGAPGMGPLAGILGTLPRVNVPAIPGIGGGILGDLAGMATGAVTGMIGNAIGGVIGGMVSPNRSNSGLFNSGRTMMPPMSPQIPEPIGGGNPLGSILGPLMSVISSIAGGAGGNIGAAAGMIGPMADMLANRNVRAPNQGFPTDTVQNNNVPPAMPSSNLLRELFDLNISPGYNPVGYAFGR